MGNKEKKKARSWAWTSLSFHMEIDFSDLQPHITVNAIMGSHALLAVAFGIYAADIKLYIKRVFALSMYTIRHLTCKAAIHGGCFGFRMKQSE